ncbi:MAG: nuclear transport factor 2 family protein [Hyphomicrobiaceae bacterium]|nr:nuclear transport factor 2 family protein [Hyphomicrobiaceae bacterium]
MTDADAAEALIRRYYDCFDRGDLEGMLACVAEDVIHDVNQGERRIGRQRFHAFCARMAHHYEEKLDDIAVMTTPDGSRAAAEFNVHGVYLETDAGLPPAHGQAYVLPAGAFFAIREGRIARITTYYNLTEWILQVSRSPEP